MTTWLSETTHGEGDIPVTQFKNRQISGATRLTKATTGEAVTLKTRTLRVILLIIVLSISLIIYIAEDFAWLQDVVFFMVVMLLSTLGIKTVKAPGPPSSKFLNAGLFNDVSINTPGIYLMPTQTIHWISKTCTGIQIIMIIIPLILMTKGRLRQKITAILLISSVIILLNVLRITLQLSTVVFLTKILGSPVHDAYHLVHDFPTLAFQFLIFIVAVWLGHQLGVPIERTITNVVEDMTAIMTSVTTKSVGRKASNQRALQLSWNWTLLKSSMRPSSTMP